MKKKSVLVDDMEHCVVTGSSRVEIHHVLSLIHISEPTRRS